MYSEYTITPFLEQDFPLHLKFNSFGLPVDYVNATLNVGVELAQPAQDGAAQAANRLSTFHTSPQAGNWQWVKRIVPVFDAYRDPETREWVNFLTGEREVTVPVEGSQYEQAKLEVVEPKVIIATQGNLAKVVKGRVQATLPETDKKKRVHRGIIQTFSAGARRRLMRLLAKTDQSKKPLFCTLTYPDVYPSSDIVKRHLDSFGKRLMRAYPEACFIWRVETVTRKSGNNIGKVAPHFHLLVWGVIYSDLREWLPTAWNEVIFRNFDVWGSGDEAEERRKHLAVHSFEGKAVQELKSWRGVMRYASKYIAKKDDNPASVGETWETWEWQGKHWGIIGKANLPLSVVVVIDLVQAQAVQATRLARKAIKLVGRDLQYGLTWFILGTEALRYVEWLSGGNPPNAVRLSGAQALGIW